MQSSIYFAQVKQAEIKKYIRAQLLHTYDEGEIAFMIRLLCEYLSVLPGRDELTHTEELYVIEAVKRLKENEPLQYILGETWFYNLNLKVTPDVLIPRPETEELVDLMLKKLPLHNTLNVMDIGTGSGCIPIALAKNTPLWKMFALDISNEALAIAKQNAERHGVGINFQQMNILHSGKVNLPLMDVIVSNPPYILQSEKEQMNPNVWAYEPTMALFVTNNDPLQFYKAIVEFAKHQLKQQGYLFFETNTAYAQEVVNLLIQNAYENVTLLQDMHGNNRIVVANKV